MPAQPAATGWTWFLLGHDRESGVGVAEDSAAIVDLEQLSTGATLTHDVCCGDVAVQQVAKNARLSGLSLVFPKCHPKSCLTMDILAKRLASNSLPVFPGCHDTIRVLISARSLTFLASARSALRWRRTAAARALRASLRAWSLVARSASSCAARSCSAWATLA